ncbi:hypothetical protein F9L33_14620 [Amylibacter sp. SFDW26]|uniref:hypothetical protein n=1 Tax=Amylibacter sp. SFDW26 TaxID=2652722 RepID=UPI001261455A|nr:hypothetical protein [Amylibacter sp. SFDW26]KAB7610127.1 hypothetical protein F9L33_14620 [Amylibacter sp. SFDW26]
MNRSFMSGIIGGVIATVVGGIILTMLDPLFGRAAYDKFGVANKVTTGAQLEPDIPYRVFSSEKYRLKAGGFLSVDIEQSPRENRPQGASLDVRYVSASNNTQFPIDFVQSGSFETPRGKASIVLLKKATVRDDSYVVLYQVEDET